MKYLKFTKNKQLLAIVLSVLLVGGCSNAVDQKDFKDADSFCSGKGGVYQIWINGTYGRTYECKDGSKKELIRKAA